MFEISYTIRSAFQDLYLVIEAFRWSISDVGIFKSIQDFPAPVSVGGSTFFKLRNL